MPNMTRELLSLPTDLMVLRSPEFVHTVLNKMVPFIQIGRPLVSRS